MESKDAFPLHATVDSEGRFNGGRLQRIPLQAAGTAKMKGVLRLRKPIR